ncbi:MAG: bifunctional DNA-formamidopyrimidine glycosylase/DNA-(apurinic or apyrimidinic site) lyase [Methylococcaceae bacterium]|nr:bifunctional DNA-formamidopyrimidine glycosylase/DNA-(apurinic or apyrimidinic site) lyase [Methylococcaceae bacterium]
MPELPEVETTRRGIESHITGLQVSGLTIRHPTLRWPIPADLLQHVHNQTLHRIDRRAKYLLFYFDSGCLLVHLGMSGSLRILTERLPPAKHDHVDIVFGADCILRYTDPRRFGAILWLGQNSEQHPLLAKLGPEPLSDDFTGEHLHQLSRNRKVNVKQFIMDQAVVTGTGNIYANEALFASGILPTRAINSIALAEYDRLVVHIKRILTAAIAQGGTTLRDFTNSDGKPGYFKQQLNVYGRTGLPCTHCQNPLQEVRINGRSSVFCGQCQR